MLLVAVKLTSVALVLGAGLWFAAKRAGGGSSGRGAGVRVEARHGLSRSAMVAVVNVDGRRFLIGAGDGAVQLLTELDEVASEGAVESESVPARPHGSGTRTHTTGPRIGLLDRCREMTVRSHAERPIHVPDHAS